MTAYRMTYAMYDNRRDWDEFRGVVYKTFMVRPGARSTMDDVLDRGRAMAAESAQLNKHAFYHLVNMDMVDAQLEINEFKQDRRMRSKKVKGARPAAKRMTRDQRRSAEYHKRMARLA